MARGQGTLASPRHLLALHDFPHQGNVFFPLIQLTKQVLQDVSASVSRWLPPPRHGSGLLGMRCAVQQVPGSEVGVFTADAEGDGGLGASSVARLEIPPEVILACLLQGWGAQAALSPGAGSDLAPWAQHCLPQHSSQLKKQDLKNCSC